MSKEINFELSRNRYGEMMITTASKYADPVDREIRACSHTLYDKMEKLANKYNNHPDGCIGVTFTMN